MLQAGLYHIPRQEARRRAYELLELVGLKEAANKKVETYSGGMRKRLDLISGLMHRPQILFLDEPTLGLDVQTRAAVWDYIKRLRKEMGMTIFMTTHYMDEADSLCDRVAIIDHGKIKAIDTPGSLKTSLGGDIIELELKADGHGLLQTVQQIRGVKRAVYVDSLLRVTAENGEKALPAILETLLKDGVRVGRVTMKKPSLEEVFLEYTGRKLREEEGSWEEDLRRRFVIRRARA
jgi:ABC-2 type transport system ATP-binding protein